jgi:hypothetical protein
MIQTAFFEAYCTHIQLPVTYALDNHMVSTYKVVSAVAMTDCFKTADVVA